jgi:hypothetical protein
MHLCLIDGLYLQIMGNKLCIEGLRKTNRTQSTAVAAAEAARTTITTTTTIWEQQQQKAANGKQPTFTVPSAAGADYV